MTMFIKALCVTLLLAFGQAASAATYYDSEESCVSAMENGTATEYKPTGKAKGYGDPRITGLGLRSLEAEACAQMDTMKGVQWVFQKQGTPMYTNGTEVKLHGECQNTIYKIVYRKPKPAPVPQAPAPQAVPAPAAGQPTSSCTTDDCGNKTVNVVEKTIVNRVTEIVDTCVVNGVTVQMQNNICQGQVVRVTLPVKVETSTTSTCNGNCGNSNGPQRPTAGPAPIAQPTNGCSGSQCREQVKVTREEARTDGRCFVQTNMGYRFELRANTSTGRLMVGLVDPSTLEKIEGTRGMYVGDQQASKNSKGVDCDGMQQQLYSNWETVRSAYNLPSVCTMKVAKKD